MSQKAYKKTKELLLKQLGLEAEAAKQNVSGYSRRRRSELLKLARKALAENK